MLINVLEVDIQEDNVLVVAVLHEEALGDAAQAGEAEALIEVEGMDVGGHNGIELKDAEAKACANGQRVLDELLADVQTTLVIPDGVAGIADVSATAHVVGVEDVETDDLARVAIDGNASIRLVAEEVGSLLLGQFIDLRKSHALAHHLVPYAHGLEHIGRLIFPDDNHVVNPLARCGLLFFVQIIHQIDGANNAIDIKGRD